MKTSKRILSFFLAVVMVITTCSVGFTAFAADNKTDSNNDYWNDTTQASDAFDAIQDLVDTYIPMLLNIDGVKSALEGLGMTITEDTSVSDLIAGLSPTLMGLLGSSADKNTIIYSVDTSTPPAMYDFYYSYLDGEDGDAMDFYALYNFCKSNQGKSGELGEYCSATYPILDELLKAYTTAKAAHTSEMELGQEKFGYYVGKIENSGADTSMMSQADFNNFVIDGQKLGEIVDSDCDEYFAYIKNMYANMGSSAQINNIADAIYYSTGNGSISLPIEIYLYLINLGGGEVVIGETTPLTAPLTVENYLTEMEKVVSLEDLIASEMGMTFSEEDKLGMAQGALADGAITRGEYDAYIADMNIVATLNLLVKMGQLDQPTVDFLTGEFYTLMKKLAVMNKIYYDENGDDSKGSLNSKYYREFCIGMLTYAGVSDTVAEDVAKAEVTDAQLQAFIEYAQATHIDPITGQPSVFIGELASYFQDGRSPFSAEVSAAFADMTGNPNGQTNVTGGTNKADMIAFTKIAAASDATPEKLKAYMSTDSKYKISKMSIVDRVDYLVPSQMILDKFGTTYIGAVNTAEPINLFISLAEHAACVAPRLANYKYSYSSYPVPDALAVEAVNSMLNDLVSNFLDPNTQIGGIIDGALSGLLESELDLYGVIENIWLKLYEKPVETIFELLPTLVIVLDELLIPIIFNESGDKYNGFLYSLLCTGEGILAQYSQNVNNTDVGLGSLSFNLNTILPSILHWLSGDTDGAIAIVGTYEGDVYDNTVPKFLNIYAADKAIAELDLKALIEGSGLEASLGTGIYEAVDNILSTLTNAVDAYLADHRDDVRGGMEGDQEGNRAQKGLNNIFVALPQLMDYIVKEINGKYDINSDWTSLYDGKMIEVERSYKDYNWTETQNATLKNFKALAKGGTAPEVLDQFVNALIGNWLNGLLDWINDLVSDTDNKITSELPLVFNLLNSLGGFGEESIISDLLNGLFQLKRSDDASFGLVKDETTGFVGFTNASGLFLLSNIQFTENGESRGIIPLIMNLVNGGGSADYSVDNAISSASTASVATASAASVAPYASSKAKASSVNYGELLSSENVELADSLISTIDGLLASLLENTSLNGFDLNSTDNILSSVVALAATAIGQDNASDLVKLLDNYVYYVVGESNATPNKDGEIGTQAKDGAVDANKVYTSANLSNLVIQTYSLVENIIDYLFYNADSGFLKADSDMLIADAVTGIISPDSVGVRMSSGYADTAEILAKDKYLNWNDFKVEISAANDANKADYKVVDLKYGFSAGDKDGFYTALAESLGGITAILGAVLASASGADSTDTVYSTVVYPILDSITAANGVSCMAPAAFANADDASKLVDGILRPISETLATVYDAPASMLLNTIKGLGSVLSDSGILGIFDGINGFVNGILGGVKNVLALASPTLADYLLGGVSINLNDMLGIGDTDIVVNLINGLLGDVITLESINWDVLAAASSPAEVLLIIYRYVVDLLLGSDLLAGLLESAYPEIYEIIKSLSATEILQILNEVIQVTQSPTEMYWTFSEYATKLKGSFSYPQGITAKDADNAVTQLDQLVANIFPLLKELGVLDADNLSDLVNGALYTNANLTALTKALYGALCGNIADGLSIADILQVVGIDPTPAGIAAYLTDTSYGKTFSSAANTLKKAKSWSDVSKLNWGFTDGSAKAQQGFINGLVAALRPLNNILAVFLVQGEISFNGVDLAGLLSNLNISISDTANIKNGILTVKFELDDPAANVLKIDLGAIAKDIDSLLKDGKLALGTNGYESAVIPLLEALTVTDLKTYSQYKSDYNKAKDNLLLNILNPLFGFVDQVIEAPFDTLAGALPNLALFIDGGGITQLVNNILAPITSDDGLFGVLNNHGINIDDLIEAIAGDDLGGILGDLLGIKGLELKLTELEKSNLHDILIPLVNSLLSSTGIVLPAIDWAQLASHGTLTTGKSAAKNADGTYKAKQIVNVDKGETLIAVLRYIANVLIDNSAALKNLLGGLLGDNATVKNIVNCVFTQIGTADDDDIVRAVFYFLCGDSTNRYFDYRGFTAEVFEFTFGAMDEDFCRQLAPMLDGLIGGLLDLNSLVTENVYTDNIISSIAVGLYGAIEGVKINDGTSLDELLAMTDIDFTAANVAELLVNEDYGQSFEDASNTIKKAGSWKNVNKDDLKWGVTDRDSFLHALAAVLRPIYGVLDVLLNNGRLNLFNMVSVPGSDGYTSFIVPLMEALGMYNIKTQYQYREDIYNEYDAILLDILNPILDKVEDLLAAPIQTLADILPNLSLVFANDGLIQLLDNFLTPVTALLAAIQPIVDINDIIAALGLDVPELLGKIGVKLDNEYEFNLYDLPATLTPLVGADNVVSLLNGILGTIEIGGTKLGLVLPEINWYQLASHGELIVDGTSQAACYGKRMYVVADQDETLIAVLRYLINTINYENNYDAIVSLIGGLLGGASDSISGIVSQILGMLQGEADDVLVQLVELLQTLAG